MFVVSSTLERRARFGNNGETRGSHTSSNFIDAIPMDWDRNAFYSRDRRGERVFELT
jgi:hypothetical protein